MTYRQELELYLNKETGMFGYTPNKANYSTGNPILELAQAFILLKRLDRITEDDRDAIIKAIESCRNSELPYFAKIPDSKGRISHDDIIGIVAALATLNGVCSAYLLKNFIAYGNKNFWVFSTDGKIYWDAMSKPWFKAFYIMAYGLNAKILDRIALAGFIVFDALFNKDDTSDKKLILIMRDLLNGKSKIVDKALNLWDRRLKAVFGSVENVIKIYYKDSNNIFHKWWK